jgi:hypothetical protein
MLYIKAGDPPNRATTFRPHQRHPAKASIPCLPPHNCIRTAIVLYSVYLLPVHIYTMVLAGLKYLFSQWRAILICCFITMGGRLLTDPCNREPLLTVS